ncbi:unnamed protein product [Fraxinus pennsylvanica]|uniref:Uncharacterized protein n=1 Tax=Fraxinus pennsylvanica TaxID=56036 RepID=A0AAD1ZN94_9LAMI|nr:unnamed protein product [Fraxinus pennsylvanica]
MYSKKTKDFPPWLKLRLSVNERLSAQKPCKPESSALRRLLKTLEDHWTIKCNDAVMRIVEARVKGSVKEWLLILDRENELKFVHWKEMSHKPYFLSTFYVKVMVTQLNRISKVSYPATMLMKPWADTLANTNTNHETYVELIEHYKLFIEKPAPVFDMKQVTITLSFEDEMVRSCITQIASDDSSWATFEALAAIF